MGTNDINELLRRGIEAARAGNRVMARDLLQQVVDEDEKNEKGWFWLASVVETDDERRICLNNVLHINPNNEKARAAMDALEAKARKQVNEEEVIPGITRRQLTLILGGGIVVIVLIVVAFAAIAITNGNRAAEERASQTRVAQEIAATGTAFVQTATQAIIAGTETMRAIATETLTPTPTSNIPTLPPTWTPEPTDTGIPTIAPLPPVTGLSGFLAGWSGRDVQNVGYLPVGYFNLEQGGTFNAIPDRIGRDVSFTPNGQRVVYARYDPLSFSSVLELVNINGTDPVAITATGAGLTILEPQQPRFSADGQFVVFVARSTGTTSQVFVYNVFDGSVRQLTNSDSEFSYPSFSPDGTRIAAIRDDVNSATPGADIVLIDTSTGGQIPVSNDKGAFIETTPTWRDSNTIIYAVAASTEPNNFDLFYRSADGTGSPLPLVREPGAELYPVISPDTQYMAFASDRTGVWEIYIYNFNDQSIAQLTQSPEPDYPSDWWAP